MKHPSQLELRQYRRRRLPAAEMLAIDDHIAGCDDCRRVLRDCDPMADPAQVLAQLGEPHLSYEEIEAYVDERAGADRRLRIESHLGLCRHCREEVADLREFAGGVKPRARPSLRWLAAAAAITITIAAAGVWRWNAAHRPAPVRSLALATAELQVPEPVLALRGLRPVVRGPGGEAGFGLLSPVATAVLSAQPRFAWTPLAGARAYRVAIFAPGFRKIAESAWLDATEWTAPEPLERGLVYSWQVIARMGTAEDAPTVQAPALTEAEAKFLVIGAAEAADIESAARGRSGEHLVLGVLYARAGLLDLAERELAEHRDAHPQSAEAGALLEKLRALRR